MVPSPGAAPDERNMTSELLTADGWIGARVERGESIIRAFFRTEETAAPTVEGCSTDAERLAAVTDSAGAVTSFFLRGSAFASGTVAFTSSAVVSASVAYTAEGIDVEVEAHENTDISVSVPSPPAAVSIDGERVEEWTYEAATGQLKLTLLPGHAVVAIR